MSKPANKTLIGVFVTVAIALIVTAVLMLGSGRLFRHHPKYVMYFEDSVRGLSVGSPVLFRGVRVGSVTDIGMEFDPVDLSVLIPVYAEFDEGKSDTSDSYILKGDRAALRQELTHALIKKGLRAQLELQSVLTGQLVISLEFHPDTKANFVGRDTRYPEIPTIPSRFQQLAKRLENVPVEDILLELRSTLAGIRQVVNSPDTAKILSSGARGMEEARALMRHVDEEVRILTQNANETIRETQALVKNVNSEIAPLAKRIARISEETGATLKKARDAMEMIEDSVGSESALAARLPDTLKELERAARSVRLLAEELNRHPEAVVWGKKKPKEE